MLVAGVILAGAVAASLLAVTYARQPPPPSREVITTTDMNGTPVTLDGADVAPTSATSPPPTDHAAGARRFAVSAVGLDVPLADLEMRNGEITPPGFRSAYVLRNLGVPPEHASEGTVFVVMHALRRGGRGPGNYLADIRTARAEVHVRDEIEVAGVHYSVSRWQAIGKRSIIHAADVWTSVPDRLVVITCLERADGAASTQNLVIWATKS